MLKNKKKLMIYLFLGVGIMGLFLMGGEVVHAAGSGVTEGGCGLFKCGNQFINFDGRIEQGYIYDLADTKPKDHEEISSGR